MAERSWDAIDARARHAKRAAVAETRRGWKIARERLRNAGVAAGNLAAKQLRRLGRLPARAAKRVHDLDEARQRLDTYRTEWAIERELARAVAGTGPIIVGPWLSEVGYEILYWVPFVRWVQAQYGLHSDRLIVVTRGGAAAWYRDITPHAVEIFDLITPGSFAARNDRRSAEGTGSLKQHSMSAMDEEIIGAVRQRLGLGAVGLLHPSLLYRLFQQFWLGHRPPDFLERRTRYRRIVPPDVALPPLPPEYVAVKFYTAASLPETPAVRRSLQSLVLAIAETTPVVMLDTGLTLDDHADHALEAASRVQSMRGALDPRDNLAVQTAIIARARSFVGTCGSLAWMAPMLGVDTTAVLADARFLHGHLQVARRVYQVMGAGRFTPLDVSSFEALGIHIKGGSS